jgi:NDP-sugar pyrophosphorylase family protein
MEKPILIILAGGKSTSFAPIQVNKTLLPFCGKPLLQHTIEMAKRVGFTDILITTNDQNDKWMKSATFKNLNIKTKIQNEPLGMASALLNLATEIDNRPILIKSAADIVDDSLLQSILERTDSSYALITGRVVSEYFPGGYIKTQNDRATSIIEKPVPGTEPSNLVSITAHYFSNSSEFISLLKSHSTSDNQYEKALNSLMQQHPVDVFKYGGDWKKIKYSFHVLDMMEYFLSKVKPFISPRADISEKATITGDVYIEDGVKVNENAVIIGPAYIGKDTIIGQNTLVRSSMIEEKVVVGFGSEVARSYIGNESMLHSNYVADSVLEKKINPSYGTIFANKRIDGANIKFKLPEKEIATSKRKLGAIIGENAFFGVNCSVMPGISIGANAKIYPGLVINKPVPNDTVYKG